MKLAHKQKISKIQNKFISELLELFEDIGDKEQEELITYAGLSSKQIGMINAIQMDSIIHWELNRD